MLFSRRQHSTTNGIEETANIIVRVRASIFLYTGQSIAFFTTGLLIVRDFRLTGGLFLHYAYGEIDAFETVLCLESKLSHLSL